MQHLFKKIFIVLIFSITFFSCKKGDTGPQGPQGEQGTQGVKGDDGSTILSGKGVPTSSIGGIGDFYIDLNASALYGPKTSSGWGSALSLKGATGAKGTTGAAGKNGSTILSGSGVPSSSLGAAGDYYFDKTNSLFYGPKTSSGWGTPVSLKGLKGDKGDPGTANVIYSGWVSATNFRDTIYDNSKLKIADIKATQITSTILSNATIMVYFTFDGTVLPLPYTTYAGNKENTMSFIPVVGKLIITRFTFDNSGSVNLSTSLQYRYIIIPGGVAATGNINLNDYNAVKKAFNLKN